METSATLKDMLSKMKNAVRLKVFTSKTAEGYRQCPACEDTAAMVRELAKLANGKIDWEELSILVDKEKCENYNVTRVPTILFMDFNIRYTGAPIGLEAAPFVQTIIMAASGETMLGDVVDAQLARIKKPGKLMVIVTPTCPYCAQAVILENALAIQSRDKVSVEIVESYENPDIARKYEVTGVPVTIVNDAKKITGVPNIALLLSAMIDDKAKMNEMYG
ncbi:MAG: thioredoxin family protein [Candidatus Lokiarchaeota archaeon]|nr:thioredoxin family protein [Candidatus Lokiarchaeota archaeon]